MNITAKLFLGCKSDKPVLKCSSDNEINEIENVYSIDKNLKRKRTILRIVKLLIVLGAIAGLILLIIGG